MGQPHKRLFRTRTASKVSVIVDTSAGGVNSNVVSGTTCLGQIGR